jgi:putative PIN family toxin of toxin-antitoxin system
MRAVVDTNVIVSATLIRNGNEDRVLRAWQRGAFDLALSPQILEEMGRALFYERIRERSWMTDADVVELLEALAGASVLVPGRRRVRASRDPDDDKFLAAALEARAGFVVSGDRDLLAVKRFRSVRTVSPATFLKVLRDKDT